ncbi:MAG: DNA mismatch repair protein MutS [Candidatus Micrarchaeia archaeon]
MQLTPGMRQYMEVKGKHPDCLVLFRMGDFFETFYDDARTVSRELDIVLTSRGKDEKKAPLAGIPFHALDSYLAKLVKKGYKVCIVEQLEDPKLAKGLVKRGVVRIITPGTVVEENILSKDSNNYICAVAKDKDTYGIAFADISTGEFVATQAEGEAKLLSEIEKFKPTEAIIPAALADHSIAKSIRDRGAFVNSFDERHFWEDSAKKELMGHFNVSFLDGFGLAGKPAAACAAGALLAYLKKHQMSQITHVKKVSYYSPEGFMLLDSATIRNLEIVRNIRDGSSQGTLFEMLDRTKTPMGTRTLKRYLLQPLMDIREIEKRHDAVSELAGNTFAAEKIREALSRFGDLERINARVSLGTASPRDLVGLKASLAAIPALKREVAPFKSGLLAQAAGMPGMEELHSLLDSAIKDEPAATTREGNIIKEGYNGQLDALRKSGSSARAEIEKMEEEEKARTGIRTLKIKFNRVFGYFIEISNSYLKQVPPEYQRKQTQANSERFTTDRLKQIETGYLGAQEKSIALEYELFMEVLAKAALNSGKMLEAAGQIASIDCMLSLAQAAAENGYVRPAMSESYAMSVVNGRHPVVERIAPGFVKNDCAFSDAEKMKIITGPNMAGKSTYLRQNALAILMAQAGSFVPADSAAMGVVDRIFSRVGAYDDLSMGQSTFMVEMSECANILNNATARSFVILDEVGRGTSTYDGFALATAIAEHLYSKIGAKTLFATHYHQLNGLAKSFPGIRNYHALVSEDNGEITFLRKIVKGGTDKSYGIHVAKLAGVPDGVIRRSREVMARIESENGVPKSVESTTTTKSDIELHEPDTGKKIKIREEKTETRYKDKGQKTLMDA